MLHHQFPTTDTASQSQQPMLPDNVIKKIGNMLGPLDRLRFQQTSRRYYQFFAKWNDVETIEIRSEEYGFCSENAGPTKLTTAFQLPVLISAKKKAIITKKARSFHVRLTLSNGTAIRLRTMEERSAAKTLRAMLSRQIGLQELTLWDACLSSEFISVLSQLEGLTTLRLWNCSKYFEKKTPNARKLIGTLLALPTLKDLLVLDSTSAACSFDSCRRAVFSKSLAAQIRAPIENLQLTGLYLPLRTMEILSENLSQSCQRLAIGCTFGKESKRLMYLKALRNMKQVIDLDLPPFIFHLHQIPVADGVVQKLLETLPLKAFGFRHYNSSVLFRFIETQLPLKIRLIRVHHSANRIPNFAALGQQPLDDPLENLVAEKKTSVVSRYSILSTSRSSIGSANNEVCSTPTVFSPFSPGLQSGGAYKSKESMCKYPFEMSNSYRSYSNASYSNSSSTSSSSSSSSSSASSSPSSSDYGSNASTLTTTASSTTVENTCKTSLPEDVQSLTSQQWLLNAAALAARQLTIFAIAEERTKRRTQRLRKRTYCGVDVIYSTESLAGQEILGRIASPMQSPHVYSKIQNTSGMSKRDNKIRVMNGDLVKPIPLSSLGMESDYELSDWET